MELRRTPRAASAPSEWRQQDRRTAVAAAAGYLGLGLLARGRPHGPERTVFHAANHDSSERPLLRVPQQLGTPWVPPLLAVVGLVTHRPHLAVTGAMAVPLEKTLEVGVKKALGRRRPSEVDPDARLHDDAPTDGPSYPSGHAAIAFTGVLLAAPYLPAPVAAAAVGTAGVASWVRVRQGAHFPLDAAGGALLGVLVATTLQAVVGRPVPRGSGPSRPRWRLR